jgi:hypothetical protein
MTVVGADDRPIEGEQAAAESGDAGIGGGLPAAGLPRPAARLVLPAAG